MHCGRLSKMLLLICFTLLIGFITSCGGSDQGPENDNSGNNSGASQDGSGATKEQSGETDQVSAGGSTGQGSGSSAEIKIALGDIVSVDAEKRRVALKPVEGERQVFRVVPNAPVTVDDAPSDLAELEEGQQAQIRYVVKKDRERARAIAAFSAG